MAKKYDPAIERAGAKLLNTTPNARAAANPSSFLLTIMKSMILPALGPLLSELLKGLSAKNKKYLIIARDVLVDAELD